MKYSDYDVISVLSVSELKDEMQKKTEQGWRPYSNYIVSGSNIIQIIVKVDAPSVTSVEVDVISE
ncbi:hypothetical protein EAP59_24985, partial [Salmonella enterica]|nr:hypothetical protein [Salmonella enterica]